MRSVVERDISSSSSLKGALTGSFLRSAPPLRHRLGFFMNGLGAIGQGVDLTALIFLACHFSKAESMPRRTASSGISEFFQVSISAQSSGESRNRPVPARALKMLFDLGEIAEIIPAGQLWFRCHIKLKSFQREIRIGSRTCLEPEIIRLGLSAGCDRLGFRSQLLFQALNDSVDHPDNSVIQSRLHAGNRVGSDDAVRFVESRPGEDAQSG